MLAAVAWFAIAAEVALGSAWGPVTGWGFLPAIAAERRDYAPLGHAEVTAGLEEKPLQTGAALTSRARK